MTISALTTWLPVRTFLCYLALLGCVTSMASGGEYYVSTAGNDTTGDGSLLHPWKTVAHALSAVDPSPAVPVTIHVAAGAYRLSLTGEQYPLNMKSYVSLKGEGFLTTILDASGSLQRVVVCDSVTHVSLEGLTLRNGRPPSDQNAAEGGGILIRYSSFVTVSGCRIANNSGGNSTGGFAEGGGMKFFNADHVLVVDNCVDSNYVIADGAAGGGIYFQGNFAIISHNLIRRNHAAALFGGIGGGLVVSGSNIVISGNEISLNAGPAWGGGMLVEGSPLIVRNTIDSNLAGDTLGFSGVAGGGIAFGSYSTALLGGSAGNGNNVFRNDIAGGGSGASGRQLYEIHQFIPLHAEYNFFGVGVDPHDPLELDGNFRVDPYSFSPVVFDTLAIIAFPSPLEFDTVRVDSSTTMTVSLFNILSSLTDSITVYSTQLHDASTLLELSSPVIPPAEIDTLRVIIHPKAIGEYYDTLTVLTSAGSLTLPVHATVSGPLAVEPSSHQSAPRAFSLDQNYPNPFNPATSIRYSLPRRAFVSIRIYDVVGRGVATLIDGVEDPGVHTVRWIAGGLPGGVYFCKMQAGGFVDVKKMVVIP